jgi:hypothetical protein
MKNEKNEGTHVSALLHRVPGRQAGSRHTKEGRKERRNSRFNAITEGANGRGRLRHPPAVLGLGNYKITKLQNDKMAIWQNGKMGYMAIWQYGNMAKYAKYAKLQNTHICTNAQMQMCKYPNIQICPNI